MTLTINDLSLYGGSNDKKGWATFHTFYSLLLALKKAGVDRFISSPDFYQHTICGYGISSMLYVANPSNPLEHSLCMMLSRFREMITITNEITQSEFVLSSNSKLRSRNLAEANYCAYAAVSACFNSMFACSPLTGSIISGNAQSQPASITNIYEDDPRNYTVIVGPNLAYSHNPLSEPLWNTAANTAYMNAIRNDFAKRVSGTVEDKRAALLEYGKVIAQMNGWVFYPTLSKRNSTSEHKRVIFYSHYFSDQNAYLCIDLENPALCFELCDHNGRWINEYGWSGCVSKGQNMSVREHEAKAATHSIKV